MKNRWYIKSYLVLIFTILYLPIIYIMYYSFNSENNMTNFISFSLEHYVELLKDGRIWNILLNTLLVALTSSLISTIIALIGVLGLVKMKNNKRVLTILSINNIPIVSPDVVIGISFLLLFTFLNIKLGFFSVLIAHIVFSTPVVLLLIYPKLKNMNQNLIDAALDLGASPKEVFYKVIIPYLTPTILAAFFTAFTYSFDDFVVTFFVTGNGFSTLSIEIYSMAKHGVNMSINALSTIMFLITLILAVGYYFFLERDKK